MRRTLADRPVVAVRSLLAGVAVEPRDRLMGNADSINRAHVLGGIEASMAMSQQKPFEIPKHAVWDAYRRVAANKDAPGVDGRTLEQFEADLGADPHGERECAAWSRGHHGP